MEGELGGRHGTRLKYKSVQGHSAAGLSYFVILFILKVMVRRTA